ncbi:MAG: hypothetical protein IJ157_08600 [Clostridia bacterium]|nr:hypothetical protein [Clostridia bacterium]
MATMFGIRRRHGLLCRSCINRYYHVHLRRSECIYLDHQDQCASCGEVKNIVRGVKLKGALKLLMK